MKERVKGKAGSEQGVVRDDDHADWAGRYSQSGIRDSRRERGSSSCVSLDAIDVKREIIIIIII